MPTEYEHVDNPMVTEGVAETGLTKPHRIHLGNDEYDGRSNKEISCGVADRYHQGTVWNLVDISM